MVTRSKAKGKNKEDGKQGKKGRVKVLNLNKETVSELTKDERKRVAGASLTSVNSVAGLSRHIRC